MIYNLKKIEIKKEFQKLNKNLQFDIIIIGTGPAAYTLYEKLNKNKNILVIERGDTFYKSSLNSKNKESLISNENYRIKKDSRIFSFGGSGNIWGGVSCSIESFEMRDRWLKNKNLWPIEHKELLSNYKYLDKRYGFRINSQTTNFKEKKNLSGFFKERLFCAKKKPFKFNDLSHYDQNHLLINATVKYVDRKNRKNIVILKENNEKIYSKKIVICCGGLETNFLILRSIKNKKLNDASNKDIVGKYFMDHPKFELGYVKIDKRKRKFIDRIRMKIEGKFFTYLGLSLNEKTQVKEKLLNSYVRFEKYLFLDLKKKIKVEIRKENFFVKYFNIVKIYLKIILLLLMQFFKLDSIIEKYKVTIFNEMIPSKNNRIVYGKKNNREKFKILYSFSNTEFKTIKKLIMSLTKLDGFNFFFKKRFNKKNIISSLNDSSHHMGGTIMGESFKTSFVNKNLEIHGIKNIFICSTSVFPTSGSFNPTMTLCSLAIRLAKYLNKQ